MKANVAAMLSDPLLTQGEVCTLLRISGKTLQLWRRLGKIKFARLGHRTIRIRRSSLSRLLGDAQ